MSYLDQEKFEDKPAVLVFNGGEVGVVQNCTVKVEKRADSATNGPAYKLLAYDEKQVANIGGIPEDKIYPVNKGYFYQDSFNNDRHEQFAVNELKHLLKTFNHKMDGIKIDIPAEIESTFKGYNDFLDYTMLFLANTIKEGNNKFDLVVDYGDKGYEKEYLRLNGYPWYIGRPGAELALSNKANTVRLVPDKKEGGAESTSSGSGSGTPWV